MDYSKNNDTFVEINAKFTSFMKTILSILVAAILSNAAVWGVEPADTLAARLEVQRYVYPQEKIHITTDKECYMAGDTIWLRAFVVDAASHCPVAASRYVYVELRNPFNEVESRVKIIGRNGVFSGYVPLDAKMAEGRFMLTAYTMFMENAGEDYFFKKAVNVTSAFSTKVDIPYRLTTEPNGERKVHIEYTDRESASRLPYESFAVEHSNGRRKQWAKGSAPREVAVEPSERLLLVEINDEIRKYIDLRSAECDSIAVTLHPEGGYLIPGKACKVAFKAIGSDGLARDIEGRVVDSRGNQATTFGSLHRGMGYFTIAAQAGESYTAIIGHRGKQCCTVPLPQPRADVQVLHVAKSHHGRVAMIEAVGAEAKCNIIVQQRGRLLRAGVLRTGEFASIDLSDVPPGILQVLLLTDDGKVLSERLFFNRGNMAVATLSAHRTPCSSREKVTVDVDLSSFGGQEGSMAVSVTDDNTVSRDSTVTILSNLLLQSDLQGYVEDAAWYFTTGSNTDAALDALMLTQGWRRYDIPAALRGSYAEPPMAIERGQEISGTVKSLWRGKPLANAEVSVIAPSRMFCNAARTDSLGRFRLNGFDLPDGTKFIVQALNPKKKNEMNFSIDEQLFPNITFPAAIQSAPLQQAAGVGEGAFIANEYARLNINGTMSVMLNEIVVKAKKQAAVLDAFTVLAHRSFDYRDFDKQAISSYEEVLRKFAGVTIDQGGIKYRHQAVGVMIDGAFFENTTGSPGGTSMPSIVRPMTSEGGAVYAKDLLGAAMAEGNTPINLTDIEMVAPFNIVKQIDFVMPNDAVFLGPRAAGGVLRITTKDGSETESRHLSPNFKAVTPLGYQRPAQHYSPRYEHTAVSDGSDLRSTVYWNPSMKIGNDGHSHFSFYTTDATSGSYTVSIDGLTQNGTIIHCVKQISLKLTPKP